MAINTILVSNDFFMQMFDWGHEWPMINSELETYIYEKYGLDFC